MPLAWAQEDYADEEFHRSEETTFGNDEAEIYYPEPSACAAVMAWSSEGEFPSHIFRLSADSLTESRPIWPSSSFALFECSWAERVGPRRDPIWNVLARIDSAVAELDDAPAPPEPKAVEVAQWLQVLGEKLSRLKEALPSETAGGSSEDLDESDDAGHELAVDWRAINKEQAEGLPRGLLCEDGSPWAPAQRIKVFNVAAEEDVEDDLLFE